MLLLASTAHLGYECMDGWMDCRLISVLIVDIMAMSVPILKLSMS